MSESAVLPAQPAPAKPKFWKTIRGQQVKIIILFSLIPLLLLFVFTYLPFGTMVSYSFYNMHYVGARKFVGWANYIEIFTRKDIIGALKISLYYMAGSVVQIALALYFATILSMKVRCGNLFKFFFTRGYVFDTVLQWAGFSLDNLPYWLKDQSINNWSLTGTSIWRYMGQNMVLFIGAIMSVDGSLYEAADLDGCNMWQKFRYIILPSIKTILVLNIILSISGALSVFDAPYVITGGQNGTGTFFIVMNTLAHTNQKVGLASAMAVFLLCIIFIVTIAQKLFFKYVFRNATTGEDTSTAPRKKIKIAQGGK
ncbi:MAG: sugar ABC transporter permease [Solobacterium sp.]|jgi:multiple sugar transport system permease protein|nr:sugar ABC transporter permease [Solobacterium sp.]MCH4221842.1 sugar ABC transporter permease [Solobacterium sp.]MCH4265165.1 sugar ABC transporter permease [Solobacterium sp.]